jgi:hypothetical protein
MNMTLLEGKPKDAASDVRRHEPPQEAGSDHFVLFQPVEETR